MENDVVSSRHTGGHIRAEPWTRDLESLPFPVIYGNGQIEIICIPPVITPAKSFF